MKQKGVTLLELLITVAIIGIIAAVAYPSYQSFMEKARRADGQAALMALAAAMERTFTVDNTYATAASGGIPDSDVFPSQAPLDGTDKYYNLTIPTANATSFEIRAVPITGGPQDNDDCKTLTLTHTGERDVLGSSLTKDDCWD